MKSAISKIICFILPKNTFGMASLWLISTAVFLSSTFSQAEESQSTHPVSETSPWELAITLGYGQRSNPLVGSDSLPLYADINFGWFGEKWFFDNGDLGFSFVNNDAVTISWVNRVNATQLYFLNNDASFVRFGRGLTEASADFDSLPSMEAIPPVDTTEIKLPKRQFGIESGLEFITDGIWGQLQASFYQNVTSIHDGHIIELQYKNSAEINRLTLLVGLGASYKSDGFNDYYWGIKSEESGSGLPIYQAKAGIDYQMQGGLSYALSNSWSIAFNYQKEFLNKEMTNSPMINENEIESWFLGVGYQF